MTVPTGGGSEVLKRYVVDGQNNTTLNLLTVGSNKICTVLNIIINNQQTASVGLEIQISPGGSGTHKIFANTTAGIGAGETFVWNEKLVLQAADILQVKSTSTNFDTTLNYIEQDWT